MSVATTLEEIKELLLALVLSNKSIAIPQATLTQPTARRHLAVNDFTFTPKTAATFGEECTSNTITVAGTYIGTPAVSITNGTYKKNSGEYTSSAGTAAIGDTFTVKATAASAYDTTVNAVLTIGGVSGTYAVTTLAEDLTQATGTLTVTGTPSILINNVNAYGTIAVDSTPLIQVSNINASGTITVSGTPAILVANTDATGTITITDTPEAYEHLTVGAQQFHFVEERLGTGEITISSNTTDQAHFISESINTDLTTVTATHTLGVVSLVSTAHGAAGNALALTTNANGAAVSGSGTLSGGIDAITADTLTVGAQTFTFVSSGTSAGNVVRNANTTTQAGNIVTSINRDSTVATATNTDGVVTLTATGTGVSGNSVVLTKSSAALSVSGTGTLSGGIAAQSADTLTVGAQTFTFKTSGTSTGDIVVHANTTTQAQNIVTSITRDLATVTATNLSRIVTVRSVAEGTAGNSIPLSKSSSALNITPGGYLVGGTAAGSADYFTVDDQVFTFVGSGTATGNVIQNADTTVQAHNMVISINRYLDTVTADHVANVVTITAVVGGDDGHSIVLTENSGALTVSAGGTLAG